MIQSLLISVKIYEPFTVTETLQNTSNEKISICILSRFLSTDSSDDAYLC